MNVVRIRGSSYFYGDEIHFRCRAGVAPARSPPVITCHEGGHWDGDVRCGGTVYSGTVYSGTVYSGVVYSGTVYSGTVYSCTVYSGMVYSGTV